MHARNAKVVEANPAHWQAAEVAARWVLFTDHRLVALPRTRERILEISSLRGLGCKANMTKAALEKFDERTRVVVVEMIERAAAAARSALNEFPPVEGLPCRKRGRRKPSPTA